jgi:hypothetical protein
MGEQYQSPWCGFESQCWEYLSMYSQTAIAPLPQVSPRTKYMMHVFGKCSWPHFRHRLTKKLQHWEEGGDISELYIQVIGNEGWCHMLVYMVGYHYKHTYLFHCWTGKVVVIHKRQVVIHIFHSQLQFPLRVPRISYFCDQVSTI